MKVPRPHKGILLCSKQFLTQERGGAQEQHAKLKKSDAKSDTLYNSTYRHSGKGKTIGHKSGVLRLQEGIDSKGT